MIAFRMASRQILMDFGSQLDPQYGKPTFSFWSIFGSWGPLGPKMAPRWLQEAPRHQQEVRKVRAFAPSDPQVGGQIDQNLSQERSKR